MNPLLMTIFVACASIAGAASAQAMSAAASLIEATKAATMITTVGSRACRRGYSLTPKGCRKIKSR
jgi:hypothetical protein